MAGNRETLPPERIRYLNAGSATGREYVLYWMQASVRTEGNLALQYAIDSAVRLHLPLVAGFCIREDFPEGNLRSFTFLVEGLVNAREKLAALGIPLGIRKGNPPRKHPPDEQGISMPCARPGLPADTEGLVPEDRWICTMCGHPG